MSVGGVHCLRLISFLCIVALVVPYEIKSELQYITSRVALSDPPFCPSRPEDFENWNHSVFLTDLELSYNKDAPQYHALSLAEKKKRIVDDSETSWIDQICPEVQRYFSVVKYNDF